MDQKKLFDELCEKCRQKEENLKLRHRKDVIIYLIMIIQVFTVSWIVDISGLYDHGGVIILQAISIGAAVIALMGLLRFRRDTRTDHTNAGSDMCLNAVGELLRDEFGEYTWTGIGVPLSFELSGRSRRFGNSVRVDYGRGIAWNKPDKTFRILRMRQYYDNADNATVCFDGMVICVPAESKTQGLGNVRQKWNETHQIPIKGNLKIGLDEFGGKNWITFGFAGLKPEMLVSENPDVWRIRCLELVQQIKWFLNYCNITPKSAQACKAEKTSDSDPTARKKEKKKRNTMPILIVIAAVLLLVPLVGSWVK